MLAIDSIRIKHFQSLHDVELTLSPFTVVVGQTSSGKSAFIRALRTLTSNQRGSSFIEIGERATSITATTPKGTVTLNRGVATKDNSYVLQLPGEEPTKWTKLNGETPAEVSDFLGVASQQPLNYASQFDKPYLLDETPAEVARTLGALTNVNVIFEGAREANRQKLRASQLLTTRADDLEGVQQRLPAFKNLKDQRSHLTAAEEQLDRLTELQQQRDTLTDLRTTLAAALRTLRDTEQQAAVPSTAAVQQAYQQLSTFQSLKSSYTSSATAAKTKNLQLQQLTEEHSRLNDAYSAALTAAGTCPTCGQSTTHAHTEGPWDNTEASSTAWPY